MDNVQKVCNCNNTSSSQTFKTYLKYDSDVKLWRDVSVRFNFLNRPQIQSRFNAIAFNITYMHVYLRGIIKTKSLNIIIWTMEAQQVKRCLFKTISLLYSVEVRSQSKYGFVLINYILVGKPEGKRPLGRPRRRWEDGIRMDLRDIGLGDVDWIRLAQDRDRWRDVVSAVKNLRVLAPRS
jgi:hypothetical protein